MALTVTLVIGTIAFAILSAQGYFGTRGWVFQKNNLSLALFVAASATSVVLTALLLFGRCFKKKVPALSLQEPTPKEPTPKEPTPQERMAALQIETLTQDELRDFMQEPWFDVNYKIAQRKPILERCLEANRVDLARQLMRSEKLVITDDAFFPALRAGSVALVEQLLLLRELSISYLNALLNRAILRYRMDEVEYFLEKGATFQTQHLINAVQRTQAPELQEEQLTDLMAIIRRIIASSPHLIKSCEHSLSEKTALSLAQKCAGYENAIAKELVQLFEQATS